MSRILASVALLGTLLGALVGCGEDGTRRFRGSVVLEGNGARGVECAGTIEFWVRHRHSWTCLEVPVELGRFDFQAPAGAWVDVGRIVLDGCEARATERFEGTRRTIVAELVATTKLAAFDARTGDSIEAIEVVEATAFAWKPEIDGPKPIEVASPWKVPLWWRADQDPFVHGWIGPRAYLVRARGRAWTRVAVDPSSGGVVRVELEPEAAIQIALADGALASDVAFELRRASVDDGDPFALELDALHRTVAVDGLAAGEYWIVAGMRDPKRPRMWTGHEVAVAHVEIAAGERRRITVSPPVPATARAAR